MLFVVIKTLITIVVSMVFFIGEVFARGMGYGGIATKEIMRYGFDVLRLHRIFLTVMSDNVPAIKYYEKAGFIREGVMREYYYRDDKYVDVIIMSILKWKWEELVREY